MEEKLEMQGRELHVQSFMKWQILYVKGKTIILYVLHCAAKPYQKYSVYLKESLNLLNLWLSLVKVLFICLFGFFKE